MGYDARGNLTNYTKSGDNYLLSFDKENRLESVKVGNVTTTFAYDADGNRVPTTFTYDAAGNRVKTTYPNGTIVYTPFPDYEVEHPPTGADTTRTTYRLAGRIVALRVNGSTNKVYYPLTDHLGNVTALSDEDGKFVTDSAARYDPFGAFTAAPVTNPSISNHGFTGHRHNNTGANDLGLIYMNARYYLPEVGRFVSPDSIVPEPSNPQSYNRYSYSYNNPINYTDSSGHCIDGITTLACVAVALKVVDYGWTAYDTWQSGRTLADPNASQADKMMAGLNVSLSLLFEALEPDDFLPVGLPADDIARRALISGAQEAIDEGGTEALTKFVQEQLGDQADDVLGAMWGALCSFSEDTLVMTEDGLSPISEIDPGDNVLAYNEETGEIGYYPVTAVWEHLDPVVLTLTIDGELIETTPEHPFYTTADEWLPAADLQIGDEIRTSRWTTSTVEAIGFNVGPQPMYNLTVATAHTYFVGSQQWLVHNSCVNFADTQLQAKFKHAADFGVAGNWNKANGQSFQAALEAHVHGANTIAVVGKYRGTIDAIHHFDSATGLNVITDLNGNFISGWRLSVEQIQNLLSNGNIQ